MSSAALPVAAAYVADMTSDQDRARGMAWFGTAVSLGVVVGPAFGGLLSRSSLHVNWRFGHLLVDGFSIPFFVAAILGLVALVAAMRWLPESLVSHTSPSSPHNNQHRGDWLVLLKTLLPLLALAFAAQFALAIFEGTFPLYAQAVLKYGPVQIGMVFVVCGLVMSVVQTGASTLLTGRVSERWQIGAGFAIMGTGIALLATARTTISVFAFVGLMSSGLAIVTPHLTVLVSTNGGKAAGAALGIQTAASSLGQAGGPVLGSALFVWRIGAPFWFAGASMAAIALAIAWKVITDGRAPSRPVRHRTLRSVSPMAERVARSHFR